MEETAQQQGRKLGLDTSGINATARREAGQVTRRAEDIAQEEQNAHKTSQGVKAAIALAGATTATVSYRNAKKAKNMLMHARSEALGKLNQDLSSMRPDVWAQYEAEAKEVQNISQEIRKKEEALKKADKADRPKIKQEIKDLRKDLKTKQEEIFSKLRADPEIGKMVEGYTAEAAKYTEEFEKAIAGAADDAARMAAARLYANRMAQNEGIMKAEKARLEAQNKNLDRLIKKVEKTNPQVAEQLRDLKLRDYPAPHKLIQSKEIEKVISGIPEESAVKAFRKAEAAAEKGFVESVSKVAGEVRLAGTARNLKLVDEVVYKGGNTEAAKLLGKDIEKAANAMVKNTAETAKLIERAEELSKGNALMRSRLGNCLRGGRIVGGAAGVAAVVAVASMVEQGTYDKNTDAAIEQLLSAMNDDADIREKENKYWETDRKDLVEWALEHTDDPEEKKLLEGIRASGYDYANYLIGNGELKLTQPEGGLTKEWADAVNDIVQTNANVNFYDQLAKKRDEARPRSEAVQESSLLGGLEKVSGNEENVAEQENSNVNASRFGGSVYTDDQATNVKDGGRGY